MIPSVKLIGGRKLIFVQKLQHGISQANIVFSSIATTTTT